jgi:excisionase family DNA binding protein
MIDVQNRFTVTPTEAASLLGISRYLVLRLIKTNQLKHKRIFRRYLLQMEQLQEWLLK